MTRATPTRWSLHDIVRENGLLLACVGLYVVFFGGMIISDAATIKNNSSTGLPNKFGAAIPGDWRFRRGDVRKLGVRVSPDGDVRRLDSHAVPEGLVGIETAEQVRATGRRPPSSRQAEFTLACEARRMAAGGLRGFVGDRVLRVVLRIMGCTQWWRSAFNEEQIQHGQPAISVWRYVTTAQFWFESMQDGQSEFIAVAAIIGLSIFLRQRGSAESKPLADPHHETSA